MSYHWQWKARRISRYHFPSPDISNTPWLVGVFFSPQTYPGWHCYFSGVWYLPDHISTSWYDWPTWSPSIIGEIPPKGWWWFSIMSNYLGRTEPSRTPPVKPASWEVRRSSILECLITPNGKISWGSTYVGRPPQAGTVHPLCELCAAQNPTSVGGTFVSRHRPPVGVRYPPLPKSSIYPPPNISNYSLTNYPGTLCPKFIFPGSKPQPPPFVLIVLPSFSILS